MPVSKQTTELTFSLRAIIFRIHQLLKERQGYSKSKHRELAKLLREGREDFARIKTEDVIANDDLIGALEILELHCEQLHVRANVLDHLAFGPGGRAKRVAPKRRGGEAARGRASDSRASRREGGGGGGGSGGGWGLWKVFGFSGSSGAAPAGNAESERATAVKEQDDKTREQDDNNQDPDEEEKDEEEHEVYIETELDRSAAVIFYAYPRIPRDIPGLPELRTKLALRWGNDFANRSQEDDPPVKLPEGLVDRLRVRRPSASLVEMYLKEIARSHKIPWYQDDDEEDEAEEDSAEVRADDPGCPTSGGNVKKKSGTNDTKDGGSENDPQSETATSQTKSGGIPEVDELARRFAALKK